VQVVEDVPLDRSVRLRQGEPRLRILERPAFSLGGIRKEDVLVP
jgi:hypothetical protein